MVQISEIQFFKTVRSLVTALVKMAFFICIYLLFIKPPLF